MREHGNREITNEHRAGDSECSRRKPLWADLFSAAVVVVVAAVDVVAENFARETESLTAGAKGATDPRAVTLADVVDVFLARVATGAIRSPIMPGYTPVECEARDSKACRLKCVHGSATISSVERQR